jgi:hypothetical protein
MIDLAQAAKYVTAIGVILGGGFAAEDRYAPATAVSEIQSEMRVDRIFRLIDEAQANGSPDWLCNALDAEFVELCTDEPDHYLCSSDARDGLYEKAGC